MGIVVCAFQNQVDDVTGTPRRYVFELPDDVDLDDARAMLELGQSIHGTRLALEKPVDPLELGLESQGDGDLVRMVAREWEWTLIPSSTRSIEDWVGARIARWAPEEVEPPEAAPTTYDPTAAWTSPPRTVPGGSISVSPSTAWVRPTAQAGERVGIVVWVQTYNLRVVDGARPAPRGHERFVHYYFQVEDPAIRHVQDLVLLLESGCSVRGWRVADHPGKLGHCMPPPMSIRYRAENTLRRDDVRMFRAVRQPMRVEEMETAE